MMVLMGCELGSNVGTNGAGNGVLNLSPWMGTNGGTGGC